MFDKKAYFYELEQLYLKLDEYISHSSRDCGPCIDCCINVSDSFMFFPLQIDYINYKLQKDNNKCYPLLNWEEAYELAFCPYINITEKKCNIYKYRPAICRTYPRFLIGDTSSLYHKCIFFESFDFSNLDSTIPYLKETELITQEISNLNIQYVMGHSKKRLDIYRNIIENPPSLEKKSKNDIKIYKKALKINPASISIRYNLTKSYFKAGETNLALEEIESLLKMDPEEFRGRLLRAKIYETLKKWDEALEELKIVIKQNPLSSQAYYMAGLIYLIKEKYDEAYEKFQVLLKFNPYALKKYEDLHIYLELCKEKINNV